MFLVDSHCHLDRLDLTPYDGKLEGALENAREHGVGHMLCVCIDLEHLDGVRKVEGVLTVRSPGGTTLVFNDAIFNQPHGKGLGGFIFRYLTDSTGGPKVTRLFRWIALKDKKALKAHFERLAATPDLKRIIVAHHRTITDRPADVLLEVAAKV